MCALPLAVMDALVIWAVYPRIMAWLAQCPGGAWRQLYQIRFVRLARQLLKGFLRAGWDESVLRRIVFRDERTAVPPTCVLAVCHTAWNHAMLRWVTERGFGLVLASKHWASEVGACYAPPSTTGLRRIVRHLRAGGRAIVALDSFVDRQGEVEQFLGAQVRLSPLAVRVAACAGVPLVPAWIAFHDGQLRVSVGKSVVAVGERPRQVARRLLDAFEVWIRQDPAQWNELMPFLRH
jgi:hypothetical protein